MAQRTPASNPFYLLLLISGIVFALTSCAYGVMVVQKRDAAASLQRAGADHQRGLVEQDRAKHGLIEFMDKHGFSALAVELVVLAVTTFAAIGTDNFWMRRAAMRATGGAKPDPADQPGRPS